MEVAVKCGGAMESVLSLWGRCRRSEEVWGRCGRVYEVSVEIVGKWGKVCWDVRGVGKSGGAHTFFYTSPHTRHLFPHPHTYPTLLPHTHLTRLSTLSHTYFPPSYTLSHFPTFFTPFHT